MALSTTSKVLITVTALAVVVGSGVAIYYFTKKRPSDDPNRQITPMPSPISTPTTVPQGKEKTFAGKLIKGLGDIIGAGIKSEQGQNVINGQLENLTKKK